MNLPTFLKKFPKKTYKFRNLHKKLRKTTNPSKQFRTTTTTKTSWKMKKYECNTKTSPHTKTKLFEI